MSYSEEAKVQDVKKNLKKIKRDGIATRRKWAMALPFVKRVTRAEEADEDLEEDEASEEEDEGEQSEEEEQGSGSLKEDSDEDEEEKRGRRGR